MTVKILTCKVCGEEIESRLLWKLNVGHHASKHFPIIRFQMTPSEIRKKHFTERTVKVSDKITEAPDYGTTTD